MITSITVKDDQGNLLKVNPRCSIDDYGVEPWAETAATIIVNRYIARDPDNEIFDSMKRAFAKIMQECYEDWDEATVRLNRMMPN